jgi:hypothetical protein
MLACWLQTRWRTILDYLRASDPVKHWPARILLPVYLKCWSLHILSPHTHCCFYYSATYILSSLLLLGVHLSLNFQLKSVYSFSRKTSFSLLHLLSDFLHKLIYNPSPPSTFFILPPAPSSSSFFLSLPDVPSSLLQFLPFLLLLDFSLSSPSGLSASRPYNFFLVLLFLYFIFFSWVSLCYGFSINARQACISIIPMYWYVVECKFRYPANNWRTFMELGTEIMPLKAISRCILQFSIIILRWWPWNI